MARGAETTEIVGRDDEVARIRSLMRGLAAGRGGLVLVEGEPGIGKSSVLTAGLADAGALGCRAFRVPDEIGSRLPPRALLGSLRAEERTGVLARAGPGHIVGEPRRAGIDDLPALVELLCVTAPVVLVLDGLQWADDATLRAWRSLSRMSQRMPLLLAAACRPVPRRPEVARLRHDLSADDAVVIQLGPLPRGAAADMASSLMGTPGPGLLRLIDLAGGNPRYVRDIVEALQRDGLDGVDVADEALADGPLPVSLATVIVDRLGFLSEETTQLLRMAALLGLEFSAAELIAVAELPGATVTAGMAEAWAAGVLTQPGGLTTFRHPLIQRALYEATAASLRSALHRHCAQILAASSAPVERVAQQLLAAPDAVDGWVLTWLAAKGEELTRRTPDVTATLLERALDHMPADDPRREPTETNLATALQLLGRFDDLERLTRQALARPRRAEHAARMTWLQGLALAYTRPEEGLNLTASPMLGQAVDERWTARLVALRALMLSLVGRISEIGPTAERALALARRIGDGLAAGYALYAMAHAASRVDACRAMELTSQALAAAGDDPETAELRLALLANQTFAFDQLGMRAEADAAVRAALALAGEVCTPRLAAAQLHNAVHWFEVGRWDDALAALASVQDVPEAGHLPVRLHSVAALIAGHRDDRASLRRHLNQLQGRPIPAEVIQEHGRYLVRARALAAEREGRPRQALAILAQQLGPRRSLDSVRVGYYGLPDMVRLALAVDDQAAARAAVEASEAAGEQEPKRLAVVNRCQGLLKSDPALLLDAAGYYRRAHEPLALAATLEDTAAVCGERSEVVAGKQAFAESIRTYLELGAAWDIRRAEYRVRPYGIGRGQRGPRRRPATGWFALTPTELKVAYLVADGLSNPDIAGELFLSRRTVQSHVSHILAKLDVRSRREIAVEAARHPAVGAEEVGAE